jgi:hypothetical protein
MRRTERTAIPTPTQLADAPPALATRTIRGYAFAPRSQPCDMTGIARAAAAAYSEKVAAVK